MSIKDEDKPWEKMDHETAQAFAAFTLYLEIPAPRTYRMVAETLGCSYMNVAEWGGKYKWVSRAASHDKHMARVEVEARAVVMSKRATESAENQWDEGKKNKEIADRIRAKANEMLDKMVITEDTEINPVDIIKFARFAADIGAIGVNEMLANLFAADAFDPATATPDQLREFLEKHGVKTESPALKVHSEAAAS